MLETFYNIIKFFIILILFCTIYNLGLILIFININIYLYKNICFYKSKNQNNKKLRLISRKLYNKQIKRYYCLLKKNEGSSETIRALSKKEIQWLAGIFDGDGSFEFRIINNKRKVHMISITQNLRDVRILYQVKNLLKMGRIRKKTINTGVYRISHISGMVYLLNLINGEIRLKVNSFKDACEYFNIYYKKASNIVETDSAYLAGLVDTDGSVILNYLNNRIELHIEVKQTEYSLNLDLTNVILGSNLKIYKYKKRNQTKNKIFYSIRFSYSSLDNMLLLYNYFKKNRLYSDFKYFRIMSIKKFLELRIYKNYEKNSLEYIAYKSFLIKFFKHMNLNKSLPKYLEV